MTAHQLLAATDAWIWRLAHRAARRYGLDADDIRQQAVQRLLESAHTYNSAKGKPTTWASYVVLSAVDCLIKDRDKAGRARLLGDDILVEHPDHDGEPDDVPYRHHVVPALAELSPRHRRVIELRHGLTGDGPHTLAEIGNRLRVTRERIRQIEKAAVTRLRTAVLARAHPPAVA